MLISEFARRTEVSARALRHYEAQRLLQPGRTSAGYRTFAEADVATVARIRLMIEAGLSTAVIREYLDCVQDGTDTLKVQLCPSLRAELDDVASRLDRESERITATRAALCALAP